MHLGRCRQSLSQLALGAAATCLPWLIARGFPVAVHDARRRFPRKVRLVALRPRPFFLRPPRLDRQASARQIWLIRVVRPNPFAQVTASREGSNATSGHATSPGCIPRCRPPGAQAQPTCPTGLGTPARSGCARVRAARVFGLRVFGLRACSGCAPVRAARPCGCLVIRVVSSCGRRPTWPAGPCGRGVVRSVRSG